MFRELTLQELNKLWKVLESSIYHQADYYGTGMTFMWAEHIDVMWDVSEEIDRRS
jgi:hypothetical protein